MVSVEFIMQHAPDSEMATHVAAAVRQVFELDAYLLQVDANERSITHRLALYLTPYFPDWDIDCEYNRDGDLPKRLMRCIGAREGTNGSRIFPDIVIHRRGRKENLLVIEVKKSTSDVEDGADISKLRGLRKELQYRYALFLRFGYDGAMPRVNRVEWV